MQLLSTGGGEVVKAQVVDNIPKRFKELKFGIQYAAINVSLCLS
jgi:DNA-directed RNA polymerase III subunit RPC1